MDITKWGLPKDEVSCPSCGKIYGHHRTKVCSQCEECEPCCKARPINQCDGSGLVTADQFVEKLG